MSDTPRVAVIIPAAGSGVRLGGGTPKALRVLRGRTLLEHALRSMTGHPAVTQVVLAVPPDSAAAIRDAPPACRVRLDVVAGGSSRQASVAAGLAAVEPDCDVVLVHDAARPIVPAAMLRRVIEAVVAGADAVVPGMPVVDTVKRIDEDGYVVQTPPRHLLRAVQTPQGFRAEALRTAHRLADDGHSATDDAGLAERAGFRVLVVDGDPAAMKVTTPQDLEQIDRLLKAQEEA